MTQPQWKLVASTDYTALYIDETGAYPPELAVADTIDDADESNIEATAAVVFRFPLKRCHKSASGLIQVDPSVTHPSPLVDYAPWFADSLFDVASSVGCTGQDLIDLLCSDEPTKLVEAYMDIGGYHGFVNFDHEPQEWTASELAAWPERGPKL